MLYIDPGTGSMLFSIAVGLLSVIWFGARKLLFKVRHLSPGRGKADRQKKGIVIYGEDKRYWTTFKGILDEFERRKVKVTFLAGSPDDPLLSEEYKYVETEVIGLGNKAYAKLNFLNARIVLATTPGLDVYQWKRSRNVDWYVHLTHTIGSGLAYRMFGTAFFDALMLSSDVFIPQHRKLEERWAVPPKEILAVGSTYMDLLMEKNASDTKEDKGGAIRVLVAPTWGVNSLFNIMGQDFLDSLVATGFDLTFRPHPQSYVSEPELIGSLQNRYPESDCVHWDDTSDNFEALRRADILISDYSGILFDFAFVFERPVLFTPAPDIDLSASDYSWIDERLWSTDVLPKVGRQLDKDNYGNLKEVIREMVSAGYDKESIREARNDCWQNRGHAAKKVVDYLINKYSELKR